MLCLWDLSTFLCVVVDCLCLLFSIVWTYHNLCIHLFCCWKFVLSSVLITTYSNNIKFSYVSFRVYMHISVGYIPKRETPNPRVYICSTLVDKDTQFSKMVLNLYSRYQCVRVLVYLTYILIFKICLWRSYNILFSFYIWLNLSLRQGKWLDQSHVLLIYIQGSLNSVHIYF